LHDAGVVGTVVQTKGVAEFVGGGLAGAEEVEGRRGERAEIRIVEAMLFVFSSFVHLPHPQQQHPHTPDNDPPATHVSCPHPVCYLNWVHTAP